MSPVPTVGVAFLAALGTAWLVTPSIGRAARRLGWIAAPSSRGVHTRPTPLLGGIAWICGVVAGIAVGRSLLATGVAPWAALAGIGVMAAVGLVDDRVALDWRAKLGAQVACAAAYAAAVEPLGGFGPAGPAIAALWIIVVTNAVNFIDNSDGLSSGTAAVAALAFAVLAAAAGRFDTALAAATISGAAVGFFVHNFGSGSIFLGDAGSLPLGFALAALALAVVGDRPPAASLPLLSPLGYPLFDLAYVIVARRARGQAIVVGGTDHTVHVLARRWGSLRGAVVALLLVSMALGAVSIGIELGLAAPGDD